MLLKQNSNISFTESKTVSNIFFSSAYAQSTLQVVDCALIAMRLPAGLVIGSAKNLGTKAILKAAGKLAGRAVGWIGMAVATYQFIRCLENLPREDMSTYFPEIAIELELTLLPWDEGEPLSI